MGELRFVPLAAEHLPFLLEVRNECRASLHDDREFTLEQCRDWFQNAKPDFRLIEFDGAPIGYFRLSNLDRTTSSIYVGADLHKSYRGRGLAKAAYQAFLPTLATEFGVATARLEVLSSNQIAHALYAKLGFKEIDRKRGFAVRRGDPVDSIVMELALALAQTPAPQQAERAAGAPSALRTAARAGLLTVASVAQRVAGTLGVRRVAVFSCYPDFERKSAAIAAVLKARGFPVVLHAGINSLTRAALRAGPDLWVGFWNEVPPEDMPRDYVFLNAEPLSAPKWRANETWMRAIRGAKSVWGYTRHNAPYVERLGVPFHYVPLGYARYYEEVFSANTRGKSLPQDIDVLFFGDVCDRRRRALQEIERRGLRTRVVSRAKPAYGVELDEMLARSKIVLGVHYYDDPALQIADLARADHLLSNRLFLLNERPTPGTSDPAFEENVATCLYDEIPDACVRFAADAEARTSWANRGHEWFKSDYALDSFIPFDELRSLMGRS